MKKIVLILLFLLFVNVSAYSATSVDFIYINGSNNNNKKSHDWFFKGVAKFHPVLKAKIEKDEFVYKHMLKDGQYVIKEQPSTYFWGYKSQKDLMSMQDSAKLLQSVSPWLAYFVRNAIADIMHDAIWVSKEHNMVSILQELHEQVLSSVKRGEKVVLLGYSAGTFITYEYIFAKMPYINVANWFATQKIDNDLQAFVKKHPRKNTCVTAFIASDLTKASAIGKIMLNQNKDILKKSYLDLDKYTDMYCAPDNALVGVINYASPIPLFYSDAADEKTDKVGFMRMMYKYLIEHDMFFLTVNFADDPLGFPNDVNYRNSEIEKFAKIKFDKQLGFLYDYSEVISFRTVLAAHTSYWSAGKRFSKAITQGYQEGYNLQYGSQNNDTKKKDSNSYKTNKLDRINKTFSK